MKITIEAHINADIDKVWSCWTNPESIKNWNFASDDWCCPSAKVELVPKGRFCYRMEAKDGSMGFDFAGTYAAIEEKRRLEIILDDQRMVEVLFFESNHGVIVRESFDAETLNPVELQKLGWQSILNNFKAYTEQHS